MLLPCHDFLTLVQLLPLPSSSLSSPAALLRCLLTSRAHSYRRSPPLPRIGAAAAVAAAAMRAAGLALRAFARAAMLLFTAPLPFARVGCDALRALQLVAPHWCATQ